MLPKECSSVMLQEGHTAFATKAEADAEVHQVLDLYAGVYQDLLAVPVMKGIKSKKEQFAGALYTTTVEVRPQGCGGVAPGGDTRTLCETVLKE